MKTPSLKRTLLLRCGLGVGILMCLLSSGTYLIVRHGLFRELERSVTQTAALLSNQVELEDGKITFEWEEGVGTNKSLRDEGLFQFWNETTGSSTRSSHLGNNHLPKFCGKDGSPLLKVIKLPGSGREALAIGLRIYPFVLPEERKRMESDGGFIDPRSVPHILVVARDTKTIFRVLNRTRWVLGAGTLLALGLVIVVIRRVIRMSLEPIEVLTLQMKDRAGHQLDSALDVPGELPVELTGLAEAFGTLLARVASSRDRERDFLRHAAHELRTPIAGLRATTDLALSQPRDAAAYASHLETCQKTAVELGNLVKRLSAISRVGQPSQPPSREPIDIGAMMDESIKAFLPDFEKRDLEVMKIFPANPLIASGDPTLVRLILNNLLDNAASHADSGSEIRIQGAMADHRVSIRLSNMARDLPKDPERFFEPLFRQEASRSDATRHLGIGLTLSRDAASAMGATLRANRTNDGWIEFVLDMPAAG